MEIYNYSESSSIIKDSFDKLIKMYLKQDDTNEEEEQTILKQNISKANLFCNQDCEEKFNKIIEKFKTGKIDTSKLNWEQNSNSNILQNLLISYYNQGFHDGSASASNTNKISDN